MYGSYMYTPDRRQSNTLILSTNIFSFDDDDDDDDELEFNDASTLLGH